MLYYFSIIENTFNIFFFYKVTMDWINKTITIVKKISSDSPTMDKRILKASSDILAPTLEMRAVNLLIIYSV